MHKRTRILWQSRTLRLIVTVVFVMAAISKLTDLSGFASTLEALSIATPGVSYGVAIVVLVAEFLVAAALLANLRGGIEATVAMLLGFSTVLLIGIANGVEVECGCFGAGRSSGLKRALVVDVLLLGLCALLIIWRHEFALRENSLKRWLSWRNRTVRDNLP